MESVRHFPQPCEYLRSLLRRPGLAPPNTLSRWPGHCVRQFYAYTHDNPKTASEGLQTESLRPGRTAFFGSRCESFRKVPGAPLERKLKSTPLHGPVMPVENPRRGKRYLYCRRAFRDSDWLPRRSSARRSLTVEIRDSQRHFLSNLYRCIRLRCEFRPGTFQCDEVLANSKC